MKVKRIDSINNKQFWVAEYNGVPYYVEKHPSIRRTMQTISCYYIGTNKNGFPKFIQDYADILYDFYDDNGIYTFTITGQEIDKSNGLIYYTLSDEFGFTHCLYQRRNNYIKIGSNVEAKVIGINRSGLVLQLISPEVPTTSDSGGNVMDVKKISDTLTIDFSQLNPEKDISLRDYQVDNKKKIYEAWKEYRSVMLQMPTGTGKTRLFVSIARDLFEYGISHKKVIKILFLAHRKELIQQISEHLGQKYHLAHGKIFSQSIEEKKYPMQVASVPTLVRRLEQWKKKKFHIIIVDEAHHIKAESYRKIIDLYPQAKILGVTATPYRLSGAGFRPEFDSLIVSPPVSDFIKKGYLSEYQYYSIKSDSLLQSQIDKMKLDFEGDYKESEMMRVLDQSHVRAKILDTYIRLAKDKKAIIYTINKDHNNHLLKVFREAGIICAAIDSDTSKDERDKFVQKFKAGNIKVLFNVNIFSEGFDCPDVEVIQLARPTKSLAMYLQQVGRGLRPHDNKESLIILDNVGLYNKFGFPSAKRKWKYHFEGKPIDESPSAHTSDFDNKERYVKEIREGEEKMEKLYDSSKEDAQTQSTDNIKRDYFSDFKDYCQRAFSDKKNLEQYYRALRMTVSRFIYHYYDKSIYSIFSLIDVNKLERISRFLVSHKKFNELNVQQRKFVLNALDLYIDFAKQFDQSSLKELNAMISNVFDDLFGINSFVYNCDEDTIKIEPSVDYNAELEDETDIKELHRILNKYSFPISDVIQKKYNDIEWAKRIKAKCERIKEGIKNLNSAILKENNIKFIKYSEKNGLEVVSKTNTRGLLP